MKTKTCKKQESVPRALKGLDLLALRKLIGRLVAWDQMGHIRENSDMQLFAPGRIEKVSSRRQVTIWCDGMFGGGGDHVVAPGELFLFPKGTRL